MKQTIGDKRREPKHLLKPQSVLEERKVETLDRGVAKMSFEELRKRARQLESDIDVKLVAFSKLAACYGSASTNNRADQNSSDTTPLLSGDQKYETISLELDYLLNSLSDTNDKMSAIPPISSSATIHTLQRHRDILQDFSNEFQRIYATIKSRKEREMLLSSSLSNNNSLSGLSRRELYLKESDHLANSERMVEEQITVAIETRDHLKTQRETFKMIQTKVNDLSNRFPIINSLLTKINLRRRRDAIVLGSVIGFCITLIIWWIL